MTVQVYWNLHRRCWSVRDRATRRVIAHADTLRLTNCRFHVSAAGRARVLRTRRKHVHAWVEGELLDLDAAGYAAPLPEGWRPADDPFERVTYNPYHWEHFVSLVSGLRVERAERVLLATSCGRAELWAGGVA